MDISNIKQEELDIPRETKRTLDNGVKKELINWPDEDLLELIRRMENSIPENDNLSYGTRAEKLEWENITFNDYSTDDCKKMWSLLQKKVRRYRTLNEVLNDTKDWIELRQLKRKKKIKSTEKSKKIKLKHPDTPFLCFYRDKKEDLKKDNPDMPLSDIMKKTNELYKLVSAEEKTKYAQMAEEAKKEYNKKLEEMLESNPNFLEENKTNIKKIKDRIPKRPRTPFCYYYSSEINKLNIPNAERNKFKELCKTKWKQLSDKAKVPWINMTEKEMIKYTDAINNYKKDHPEYKAHPVKKLLTKEEMHIKQRMAGKPLKPPQSAYSLFASELLNSSQIKNIPVKERLRFVSNEWKKMSEIEKEKYKTTVNTKMDKYKQDFANYLKTLPEEQRQAEMLNNAPKRKVPQKNDNKPTKIKNKIKIKEEKDDKTQIKKFEEPEQPPISAYKYFLTIYKGSDPPAQKWKSLSSKEKQKYDDELMQKKRQYITDFEAFLNSLSKSELEEYSKLRKKQKQDQDDDDEEEDEDEDEEEDDEEDDTEYSGSGSESD